MLVIYPGFELYLERERERGREREKERERETETKTETETEMDLYFCIFLPSLFCAIIYFKIRIFFPY